MRWKAQEWGMQTESWIRRTRLQPVEKGGVLEQLTKRRILIKHSWSKTSQVPAEECRDRSRRPVRFWPRKMIQIKKEDVAIIIYEDTSQRTAPSDFASMAKPEFIEIAGNLVTKMIISSAGPFTSTLKSGMHSHSIIWQGN